MKKDDEKGSVEITPTTLETSNDVAIKKASIRNGEFADDVGDVEVVLERPAGTNEEAEVKTKVDKTVDEGDVVKTAYKSVIETSDALKAAIGRDVEKELRPSKYLNRILKGSMVALGVVAIYHGIQFLRNNT